MYSRDGAADCVRMVVAVLWICAIASVVSIPAATKALQTEDMAAIVERAQVAIVYVGAHSLLGTLLLYGILVGYKSYRALGMPSWLIYSEDTPGISQCHAFFMPILFGITAVAKTMGLAVINAEAIEALGATTFAMTQVGEWLAVATRGKKPKHNFWDRMVGKRNSPP